MLGQPIYMLLPEVVGMELTGKLGARRDGDRPRAHRHRNPPQGKSRRQVRRVLRRRRVDDVARRPRDDRQHGARVRRDDGLLPRRRPDAPLPPPDRPHEGRSRAGRALHEGARPVPHRHAPVPTFTQSRAARSVDRRAEPRRPEAAAGSRAAVEHEAGVARRRCTEVYGKQSPTNGSPEGRWEGEGGHKIEPSAPPIPTPAAAGRSRLRRRRRRVERQEVSTSSTATSSSPRSPAARTRATPA